MKYFNISAGLTLALLMMSPYAAAQQNNPDNLPANQSNSLVFCSVHSLQDAVDRAAEGGWIVVQEDCHEEIVVRKNRVRITGVNEAKLFPPAGGTGIMVLGNGVEISGLEIRGGDHAIHVAKGGSATITKNRILDATDRAIFVTGSSFAEIDDNLLDGIEGNTSQIFVAAASNAQVVNNRVSASSGSGIAITGSSSAQIGGNDFSGTTAAGILILQSSHAFLLSANQTDSINPLDFFCGNSGSVFVNEDQNMAGLVIVAPGCDVATAGGVTFP